MRFFSALTSALALLPLGATALQNKNGPFVVELQQESVEVMKQNILAEVDAAIFNGLASPLKAVFDGVGDILVGVLDLLGDVVGTVFYLTEDGKLYIEGMEASSGIPGFSLGENDELLYQGQQMLGGFEGQNFKLAKNSSTEKRDLFHNINAGIFIPVSVNALDWNPAAPSIE